MKAFYLKHKKIIWVALAIMFIFVLFWIKNPNLFISTEKYFGINQHNGLSYNPNDTVADLVNKSTSGDGIPDWEKILYGLDPTKSENVPGIPDSVTIAKLQAQQTADAAGQIADKSDAGLTQTDQFSRELFASIVSLDESGAVDANGNMDQGTVDKLSNSLENNIQNSPQRKIYTLADLNITNDESFANVKLYAETIHGLSQKDPTKNNVLGILNKFSPDDTGVNVDTTVLPELDPIIKKLSDFQDGMLKTKVPGSLAGAHLDIINALEGILENLNDVKLYDTDPIVSFSGMTRYETNSAALTSAFQKLKTETQSLAEKDQ